MRRSASVGLPTLGLPVLAGASGEAVDSSTHRFFAAQTLQQEEEEEAAKVKLELDVLLHIPRDDLSAEHQAGLVLPWFRRPTGGRERRKGGP